MRKLILIPFFLFAANIFAQSLLDKSLSDKENSLKYEINGYLKGSFYAGLDAEDNAELKNILSEASLKLSSKYSKFGKAFTDIRFSKGMDFGDKSQKIELREAYVNATIKNFDFTIGQQIISWGRTDGFNPTNNITPMDYVVRSPEFDDSRLSNFLVKAEFGFLKHFKLEAIWIPNYLPSKLPISIAKLPVGISLDKTIYPDTFNIENSAYSGKLTFQFSKIDGSFSYLNGYNLMSSLKYSGYTMINDTTFLPNIFLNTNRQHVFGFDFSTSVADFGLRGEAAYKLPVDDYKTDIFIPQPEIHYVLGIDRTFGSFTIIAQYIGKYIFDFEELEYPVNPLLMTDYQLCFYNNLIQSQQEEFLHTISLTPSFSLFYETLNIEISGLYNISTEEYMLAPKISYNITDGMNVSLGANYFNGKENTMFDFVETDFNAVFLQLKASF